jgi:pumilio RNA-binding family
VSAGQRASDRQPRALTRRLCLASQHVLEHGSAEERISVVRALAGQLVELSRHKFASNVVEKCIQHCTWEDRGVMIAEVLSYGDDGSDLLLSMMTDQYSNYVVQRLLEFCDDEQKARALRACACARLSR